MHPLVKLAREAVELYVRAGKRLELRAEDLTPELRRQAGVFVCLKISGSLRGCIGTFEPVEPTVAHETVRNAVSAATCDPRFPCLQAGELESVEYTVDVLTPPEPVHDPGELDPRRYGVIVQSGELRGLLLPDLEGVNTVEMQLNIARQKAGIPADRPANIYRFEVQRLT